MLRRATAALLALLLAGCAAGVSPDPAPPGPARLLLALPDGFRMSLRPVDPVTLADLPGFSPIPFYNGSEHAFTPDGRTLAFFRRSSGEQGDALHFVDVENWVVETIPLSLANDWAGHLFFSTDGSTLYWIEVASADQGVWRPYVLHRFGRTDGTMGVISKLPETFMPLEVQPLADGRVAIFGQAVTDENMAEGDARVLLIRLTDGEVEAEIPLPGVVSGQRTSAAGEYRYDRPGLAWDVERSLLYVVDGSPDRVTVVDLAGGRLARQAELRTASWLERLGLVRIAAAKALPGTWVSAALSPGGDRLYVAAFRDEVEGPFHSPAVWRSSPLGLTVIDTAGLRVVRRLDLPVGEVALAPDGRTLILWGRSFVCEGSCTQEGHGIYLVDAATLKEKAHLLPGNDATLLGFSPDGRYAYIGEDTGAGNVWHLDHRVLDLATARLGATRKIPRGYAFYVQ
ncbi:dipeptidyl aminopeptidase/acylaminoacyl peptidase [Symbiobacterium terraclitae]|uniref:Dipeptidyl aminopeptidase/acylaminoacyl peptidase n=1 Tax=Symbiobacterium terraclitae TaxID=557451 RepID=A0ABS4JS67_9FIRM|nr:PD40 domain-containing protein [Symbiobacterium terraclitae]MBP2017841.1 dipeptidyl aminopeptidase/acylaminoacyl peptidase [Symbiobacterium terraclitae]